ncbi:MAG: alanine racemase [Fusobacteriota bacterium]
MIKKEIDYGQYKKNYLYMKKQTTSKIMPIIKADAYGNGMIEIARQSEKLGADFFGVAFLKSAIKLRKNGINSKILILNYIPGNNIKKAINYNLRVTIYSLEQLKTYYNVLENDINKLKIHININTGMNRLGIDLEDLKQLQEYKQLEIEGAYSHFYNADKSKRDTEEQFKKYLIGVDRLQKIGYNVKIKHIANSAGALLDNRYHLDYVRVGMVLYGLQPLVNKKIPIEPILDIKTIISNVRYVKKGDKIGYGEGFLVKSNMKIATIPFGYSNGYIMNLSNKGYVLVKGKKCKIIGNISMEQTIIDVSKVKKVKIGSEVVILGKQLKEKILPGDLAKIAKTVPDDIICKLS